MSVAINCSFTIYFACYCLAIEGFEILYVLGLIEALVFCGLGWILTCSSVSWTHFSFIYVTCLKTCQEIEFCIWLPLFSFKTSCFPPVQRWSNSQLQSTGWLRPVIWFITADFLFLSKIICCLRTISSSWWQHFWFKLPLWKRTFTRWR